MSDEVKQAAWESATWQEIGKLSQGEAAAEYRIQSFQRDINRRPYRLVVIYSANLDERKKRSLESRLTKEEERLRRALTDLEKHEFHFESDARQATEVFSCDHRSSWFRWQLDVQAVTQPVKRNHRGRPKKHLSECWAQSTPE